MKTDRLTRINELIRQQVSELLQHYTAGLVKGMVTVLAVETSPDLVATTVYVSNLDESVTPADTLDAIRPVLSRIQQELNRRLALKVVPRLTFQVDSRARAERRIEELLAGDTTGE